MVPERLQPFIDLAVTTGQISADDAERVVKTLNKEFKGKTKLISYNEAAERLGVTRLTVDRMAKSGKYFRNYKFPNGHCRINENELDSFIEAARDRDKLGKEQ